MNTFQNADAKTAYFRDKTHYLAFKAAWAKSFQTKTLDSRHMMLYAWLRGKDIRSAFTPVQSVNKLNNGHAYNRAISNAYWSLKHIAEAPPGSHWATDQAKFLEAFGGHLDAETLKQAFQDMPKHFGSTDYYSNAKIIQAIAAWKASDRSESLWDAIEVALEAERKAAQEQMMARQAAQAAAKPTPKPAEKGFFGRMFS